MAKKRLDVLMVEQGLAESRQKAQALIMAGQVFVGERRYDKAGISVDESVRLEVRGQALRYVSRGGLKLEKAMTCFPIRLDGCTAADIGAPPAALRTVCSKTEPPRSTLWTSGTDNWRGQSEAISE